MSKVITVGARKGGVGKSAIAVTLAYYLTKLGFKTMLMDTDSQGSAMYWHYDRKEREDDYTFFPISHHVGNLVPDIKQYRKDYDFIIIDVAGRDGRELRTAMAASDLIVSPVQPSQVDISTLQHLVEKTLLEIQDINPELKMLVVLNKASTNIMVKDAHEYAAILKSDFPEVITCERKLLERKAYKDCWISGQTIFEFDDKRGNKAREEFIEFTREIFTHINMDLNLYA